MTTDADEAVAVALVRRFWALMDSGEFAAVGAVLAPGFVLEWPQSNERIRGADRFVQMNVEYPAHGPWRVTVHRIVGGAHEAVSDMTVTDGVQRARAISFFDVEDGRIARIVEFWPESYPAPANRAHLVEPLA